MIGQDETVSLLAVVVLGTSVFFGCAVKLQKPFLHHFLLLICCFYCSCIIWWHSASSAQPLPSFLLLNVALTQSWIAYLAKWATAPGPQTFRSPKFLRFTVWRFLCDHLIHLQIVLILYAALNYSVNREERGLKRQVC